MSSFPSPVEQKKPSFLRRPVPMWAFLLLVGIFILLSILPLFITVSIPTIQQPLVIPQDSRTIFINATSITANFTVANLNTTSTISATATATLAPSNVNITLTISGVQTRNTFTASGDHKTVAFPPGASILVVRITPQNNNKPGNYTIQLALAD